MYIEKRRFTGTIAYAQVYSELITAARYRGTVTYQEIAKIMGLPIVGGYMARETGQMLGEISENEMMNQRPMLSAIAVNVHGLPGPGFYNLAKELGKQTEQPDEVFWKAECLAVYDTWKVKLKETPIKAQDD